MKKRVIERQMSRLINFLSLITQIFFPLLLLLTTESNHEKLTQNNIISNQLDVEKMKQNKLIVHSVHFMTFNQ
jgi:hypothetical protein